MSTLAGHQIIANALAKQGVKYAFGVVGIPVIEIAVSMQAAGIQYFGMRNEQAASYAASAIGYLSGVPAVCLCVSGPGIVHAFAGMANAQVNCWPMIVIGGSSETRQENMGAFQEFPQVDAARPHCKFTCRPASLSQVPSVIEKAMRLSTYGRPGVCYIDIPADYVNANILEPNFGQVHADAPLCLADFKQIDRAVAALASAKNPLFIVGKGYIQINFSAQYSRAENQLLRLVEALNVPFLPTPMAKGCLDDEHKQCVSAARSTALKSADVVVLFGARLNWILHFGQPPRFRPDVKIIQVDIAPEEFGVNVPKSRSIFLYGHLPLVCDQLFNSIKSANVAPLDSNSAWWANLSKKINANKTVSSKLMQNNEIPMSYYRAFAEIKKHLPRNVFLVSEGANTMDIGRTVLDQHFPRSRLDAATFGTMGLGIGNAIAAQIYEPDRMICCIQGDSAFGFSGMELETACRYRLPILFIIINNNGMDKEGFQTWEGQIPATVLLPEARYEMMAKAFGGHGVFCTTPDQVSLAVAEFVESRRQNRAVPTVVNVMISPYGERKQQEFEWLTRTDEAKL